MASGTNNWSYAFAPTPGQTYEVQSRATDSVGNEQTSYGSGSFMLDVGLPTSAVTTNGYYGTATWTGSIAGTASDAESGLARVDIMIRRDSPTEYYNGSSWQSTPVWVMASGMTDWTYAFAPQHGKTYTIQSRAQDQAGNQQTAYGTAVIIYDSGAPTSSVTTSGLLGAPAWAGAIMGLSSDDFAGVENVHITVRRTTDNQYFDGTNWGGSPVWLLTSGTNAWSYAFTPTQGITYTVQSRATDRAGNVQAAPASASFSYDGTTPTSTVGVSGFRSPVTWTGAITGTAADGESGVQSVALSIERLSDHKYWSGAVWQAAEAWLPATGTLTWFHIFAPAGGQSYRVHAKATDRAGNEQPTPSEGIFTYDGTKPASSIATSGFYRFETWLGQVSGAASDDLSGVQKVDLSLQRHTDNWYYNGTTWQSTQYWITTTGVLTWTYPFAPTDGLTYTARSRATDAAGNVQTTYGTATFSYDTQSPDSIVGTHGYYSAVNWTGQITGTATDGASGVLGVAITVQRLSDNRYWNGTTWQLAQTWITATGTTAWSYPFTADSGVTYTVQSRAVDRAGNTETTYGTNSFALDLQEPDSLVGTVGFYRAAAWTGAITGTASAGVSGVLKVEITIQRSTDAQYFNGIGWQAAPQWLIAAGTSAWSYAFNPTEGVTYTVRSSAWSTSGNQETAYGQGEFLYDATQPAAVLGTAGVYRTVTWTGAITGTASDAGSGVDFVDFTLRRSVDNQYFSGATWVASPVWLRATGAQAWSYPFAAPGESIYTLQLRPADKAGNIAAPPGDGSFVVDNIAPFAPADPDYNEGWQNTNVFTVTWTNPPDLSGIGGAYYKIGAVPTSPTDGHFVRTTNSIADISVPGQGVWDLYLWLQDNAGNVTHNRRLVAPGAFHYDATAPATTHSLSGPAGDNGWFKGTTTVTLNAVDQPGFSGVNQRFYRVDAGAWQTTASTFQVSGDAVHEAQYYSTDVAGNVESTHTVTVGIDTTAPSVTHSISGTLSASGWYTAPVTIVLSGTDATSGVSAATGYHYRLGALGPWQAGKTFVVSGEGTRTFYYYVVDRAGNESGVMSGSFQMDTVLPLTLIQVSGLVGDNGWYRSSVGVSISVTDTTSGPEPGEVYYRVDSGPWTKGGTFGIAADGDHVVEHYAVDRAGNRGTPLSTHVKVDATAPAAPIGLVPSPLGWTNVNRFNISWMPPADTSGIAGGYYKLDAEPTSNTDGVFALGSDHINNIGVGQEGRHSITVWLRDNAGNINYLNRAAYINAFLYDPLAPTTNSTLAGTVGNNSWFTSLVTITLRSQDQRDLSGVAGIAYRIDSTGWVTRTAVSSTDVIIDAQGKHVVDFRGLDTAGNVETVRSLTVRMDNVAPGRPSDLHVAPAGWSRGNTYTATWRDPLPSDDSGIAAVYYKLNAPPSGPTDGTRVAIVVPSVQVNVATNGEHDLYIWLEDSAGNIGDENYAWVPKAIRRDTQAPAVSHTLSGTLGSDGWYISPVTVNFVATDTLSSVAAIRYQVDGGAWATGASVTVSGDGERTIAYRAEDLAGNQSAPASVPLKIDRAAPAVSHSLVGTLGSDGWYISTVTLSFVATDTVSGLSAIQYQVNGGAWTVGNFVTITSDGQRTVSYRARDKAGNLSVPVPVAFKVDRNPPAASHTLAGTMGANGWYISAVTLQFVATDTVSGMAAIRYQVDGGAWATGASVTVSGDGEHTIAYRAEDLAGNQSALASVALKIDRTAPAVSHSLVGTLGSDGWYISTVTLSFVATDTVSGLSAIQYKVDSGAWTTGNFVTVATDGQHTVSYRARDVAGNLSVPVPVAFKVDRNPPAASHTLSGTLGANNWYVSAVTLQFVATDTVSGMSAIRYQADDGAWVRGSSVTVGDNGQHTVKYQVEDKAGNQATSAPVNFKIDRTAPAVSHALSGTMGASGWYVSPVTVNFNATDGTSGVGAVRYQVDGGAWATGVSVIVGADGQHTVKYQAEDAAGNLSAEKSVTFKVDRTAPAVSHSIAGTLGLENWYVSSVTLTFAATDTTSGLAAIRYQVDGGAWTAGNSVTLSSDGQHTVTYRADDVAGNQSAPVSVPVKIDRTAPGATVNPLPAFMMQTTFTVSWTGLDPAPGSGASLYDVQVADGLNGAWADWLVNTNLTSGQYAGQRGHTYGFHVRARDGAGNQGSYPQSAQTLAYVSPLLNGGLDMGNFTGWNLGCLPAFNRSVVTDTTHMGVDGLMARLGDPAYTGDPTTETDDRVPVGAACISQTFAVPSPDQMLSPMLSFWYHIYTWDVVQGTSGNLWDSFDVTITRAGGQPQLVLRDGNYVSKEGQLLDLGWRYGVIDLAPYAGRTITVQFENWNRNDRYYNTWTLLDEVLVRSRSSPRAYLPVLTLDFNGARPAASALPEEAGAAPVPRAEGDRPPR